MTTFFKKIFIISAAFIVASCAGRGFFDSCYVTGAEFSKAGSSSVVLRFTHKGACDYKLVEQSQYNFSIELPFGEFEDFDTAIDEASGEIINSIQTDVAKYNVAFNSPVYVEQKKEGFRTVFIVRKSSGSNLSAASRVLFAKCSSSKEPFYFSVSANGVSAYDFGMVGNSKGYLDIFNVDVAPEFKISPQCRDIISVSAVDFPKRTRFIINHPNIKTMKAYGKAEAVLVSEKSEDSHLYILKIEEVYENNIQTIKIHTSSDVTPEVKVTADGVLTVFLGKGLKVVKDIDEVVDFSAKGFKSLTFAEDGENILLVFKLPAAAPTVDVYVEKTDYGFALYAKNVK